MLFRKWFWDSWDNLLRLFFINGLFIVIAGAFLGLLYLAQTIHPVLLIGGLVISIPILFLFLTLAGRYIRDMSNYIQPEWRGNCKRYLQEIWRPSLLFGIASPIICGILIFSMRFYWLTRTPLGFFAAALLFWLGFFLFNLFMFLIPIMNRLELRPLIILRKGSLIILDNPGVVLGTCPFALLLLFFCLPPFILFFGVGSLLVFYDSMLKLLLIKYDYLSENPNADRRRIPWRALLRDENELIGKRTLKGTIFPWKE